MNQPFDHSPRTREFWRELVRPLLRRQRTPFYLFSIAPVQEALAELDRYFKELPVRHWYSCKTQPLRPLLQWWLEQGRGIEVVSEFECLAALKEGFPPDRILINGPAKHHWLPRHGIPGLLVNLDSPAEARALTPLAKRLGWTLGVRLNTPEEFDPQAPQFPTQFGMTPEEAVPTIRRLRRAGARLEIAHFHLRTNVASPSVYQRTLSELAVVCRAARWSPRYVDCGGGFPPPHVQTRGGKRVDAQFSLSAMAQVYRQALREFPDTREIWLENGRWLTARSGVLVVKILDVKERRGMRLLICDGGRTTNALISTWETHELLPLPLRGGTHCPTTVTGPTCMAFDQLARRPLPRGLRAGDHLLWLDAGAYHLSWEIRFSHGWAAMLWHDGRRTRVDREAEPFAHWWGGSC